MSGPKGTYLTGVLKGLQSVLVEIIKLQDSQCRHTWNNSAIKNAAEQASYNVNEKLKELSKLDSSQVEKNVTEILQRSSMVLEGLSAVLKYSPATIKDKYSADYDLDVPNELTLYSSNVQKNDFSKFGENSTQTENDTRNTVMNEYDVVSQHESRLKIEVERHLKPSPDSLLREPEKQNSPKARPVPLSSATPFTNAKSPSTAPAPTARKTAKRPTLDEKAKERAVPASRLARVTSFGSLIVGLGLGTAAEMTRRTFGGSKTSSVANTLDSAFITPANAERIVNTLCKVRGAALKIGQIFSIQDSNIISPEFQKLFERVRQSADFMPTWQVEDVMKKELGKDWKQKLKKFEMKPFAAASIGQVHAATLPDGREVAIKIQYPGVAKGIESDIDNLMMVLKFWDMFPKGMYIDNLVEVAKRELSWEVDYTREAECTKKFKKLLEPFPEYYVPDVIDDLCTNRVFTTELIEGIPVDKCVDMDFDTKCRISMLIQNLVLHEMFKFRYMQTDPNWSNFFYNPDSKQLVLLDFGATRSYEKKFIDQYLHVVKAALDGDRKKVLSYSERMGFLTGYESKVMQDAHVDAVMILGEILRKEGFDFGGQNTIHRIQALVPTIIHHRLCPPPEEVYSLHRKLSGAFLLYTKLKAKLSCHDLFMKIYNEYEFDKE